MIQDHLDHRASKEPTLDKDSSVPSMHDDPSDLGSLILIRLSGTDSNGLNARQSEVSPPNYHMSRLLLAGNLQHVMSWSIEKSPGSKSPLASFQTNRYLVNNSKQRSNS